MLLSIVLASRVIPAEQQTLLRGIGRGAIALELALLLWIGVRARAALRRIRASTADPLAELRRAAREVIPNRRVAEIVATELATFWFALAAWRRQPHVPENCLAFTTGRRSGHGGLVFGLVFASAVEATVVHLLIAPHSPLLAWLLTAATAYGALWLIADARAMVLRPLLAGPRGVRLRAGLRWSASIPINRIAAVQHSAPDDAGALKLTLFGAPTIWLECDTPVVARGPYGIRRRTRWFGIAPDDAAGFEREISALIG